jgi:TetR/AcrR family transcriptional regulator
VTTDPGSDTDSTATPDSREPTRERLIGAALIEFSRHGYEGASTRAIARRAGCHQPQINYHFSSKQDLWEAAVGVLLDEMSAGMQEVSAVTDPIERFVLLIRRSVEFAASRPELARIMTAEAMNPSPRLNWIVDRFSRSAHAQVRTWWTDVRLTGAGPDIDDGLVSHLLLGATTLPWANEPELVMVTPMSASRTQRIQTHADALVRLFVPSATT